MLPLTLLLSLVATASALVPHCDISGAKLVVPDKQTALVVPSDAPSFIGLAIGIQNYTCTSSGNYTNVGAVAELFDVSCLYGTPEFPHLQDIAFAAWKFAPPSAPIQALIAALDPYHASFVLGQHYFVNASSGTGISPVWDFSSASLAGHPDAFVLAAKTGDIPAPTDPSVDVDWLSLNGTQGALARQVFRVNTVGGEPPAKTCRPGSAEITVKYSSVYWLYGSTVQQSY